MCGMRRVNVHGTENGRRVTHCRSISFFEIDFFYLNVQSFSPKFFFSGRRQVSRQKYRSKTYILLRSYPRDASAKEIMRCIRRNIGRIPNGTDVGHQGRSKRFVDATRS